MKEAVIFILLAWTLGNAFMSVKNYQVALVNMEQARTNADHIQRIKKLIDKHGL